MSVTGVTINAMMGTLEEVEIKLVFYRINTTFTGITVVLRNLSLPIILGISFLKNNSLSPLFTPKSVKQSFSVCFFALEQERRGGGF